ncbi:MAG: DNA-processing protein DprA [Bacillota bacterium]
MDEKLFLVGLCHIPGLGARKIRHLRESLGTAEAAWRASKFQLQVKTELGKDLTEYFVSYRDTLDLSRIEDHLKKLKISVVSIDEAIYPENLRYIFDPPPVLFYRGSWEEKDRQCLAIVGSRKPTPYGRTVAELLAGELSASGFTIVSGLARGIDSTAHRGCLRAGGRTIAVLGSGLDMIYPRENGKLAQEIADHGVLVSEYPPGTPPKPFHFPARNRIISGLSLGVIVVEAAARSGALITADLALEQGREVFAVPGPITSPTSGGTNNLIKQGAKLVAGVADILEEYGIGSSSGAYSKGEKLSLTADEASVYNLLDFEPYHIDQIAAKTGWPAGRIYSVLIFLELNGLIEQLPGKYFIKKIP